MSKLLGTLGLNHMRDARFFLDLLLVLFERIQGFVEAILERSPNGLGEYQQIYH